jgi:hypothetical protein
MAIDLLDVVGETVDLYLHVASALVVGSLNDD